MKIKLGNKTSTAKTYDHAGTIILSRKVQLRRAQKIVVFKSRDGPEDWQHIKFCCQQFGFFIRCWYCQALKG